MPMIKSGSKRATEENFHDFRHGRTYARTRRKYGKDRARRQMIAAVMANKRRHGRGRTKSR
jgi:hypothetical protein